MGLCKLYVGAVLPFYLLMGCASAVVATTKPSGAEADFFGTWKVELSWKRGPKSDGFDDKVRFPGGAFESNAFTARGFKVISFRVDYVESTVYRMAQITLASDKEGTIEWRGRVGGDVPPGKMDGTMFWRKPDGTEVVFSITGTKLAEDSGAPQPAR